MTHVDIAIIGNGDEYVQTLAKNTINRGVKTFLAKPSMAPTAQQKSESLRGAHNAENAAAAALALRHHDPPMHCCGRTARHTERDDRAVDVATAHAAAAR